MGVWWSLQAIRKDLTWSDKVCQNISKHMSIWYSYDFNIFQHFWFRYRLSALQHHNLYTLTPCHLQPRARAHLQAWDVPWVPCPFAPLPQIARAQSSTELWNPAAKWDIHYGPLTQCDSVVRRCQEMLGVKYHAHDISLYISLYFTTVLLLRFIEIFRKFNVDFPQSIRAWQWHTASPYVSLKAKAHLQQVQTSWLLCLDQRHSIGAWRSNWRLWYLVISSDFGYFWII